jgi:hypothetical protein
MFVYVSIKVLFIKNILTICTNYFKNIVARYLKHLLWLLINEMEKYILMYDLVLVHCLVLTNYIIYFIPLVPKNSSFDHR